METGCNRVTVMDRKGNGQVFLGCDWYRLDTKLFGLVLKVVGWNGSFEETCGYFFCPTAAMVGLAEMDQLELAKKRKDEMRAATL